MNWLKIFTFLIFCFPFFSLSEIQAQPTGFRIGEKLVYSIKYMGIPIGNAEGQVLGIEKIKNRQAYHIQVSVRSNPVIDFIHKVRGIHHSYIDKEKLYSLRYEAWEEGNSKPLYTMEFDHANQLVDYVYPSAKQNRRMEIFKGSQDQVSLAYVFRLLDLAPNQAYKIPLHADQKKWMISVLTHESIPIRDRIAGPNQALKVQPSLDFINALAKKGTVEGWITLDDRRIPLSVKVRVPILGSVKAELVEYSEGACA